MALYLSMISIFVVLLMVIDILCGFLVQSMVVTILAIIGAVVIEFAIDGCFAGLVHFLPNKWFGVDNKFYHVGDVERKFYEKLKIRKWKDKVWELGSLGGFSKKELKSSSDASYLKQFIIESNKGVLTHILGCVFGFLLLLFYIPLNCFWIISLPVAIVNLLLNLPSLFILRYNTPKLQAGYKRLQRNEQRQTKEQEVKANDTAASNFETNAVVQKNNIKEEAKI